jgi:hypothetical protein
MDLVVDWRCQKIVKAIPTTLILLAFLLAAPCRADSLDSAIRSFGFHPAPVPTGNALAQANQSGVNFRVKHVSGALRVETVNPHCPARPIEYRAGKNLFIGTDRGEWGGSLDFYSEPGNSHTLIQDNIVAIHELAGDLVVFTGLAHLSLNRGAIWKISDPAGIPRAERITLLPDAPCIVLKLRLYDKSPYFLIIGSSHLTGYYPEFDAISLSATNLFWSGLYPNSAVFRDDALIVGIRSGLGVIELKSGRAGNVKYFAPNAPGSHAQSEQCRELPPSPGAATTFRR